MKDKPSEGFRLTGFCLFFVFCLFVTVTEAQVFSPAVEDSVMLVRLLEKYQQQYQVQISQLPSQYKKDLTDIYQKRWKNIQQKFDKKELYTDVAAQDYLNKLVAVIRLGNPTMRTDFSCYFSRSAVPNAEYIGEGIILFNMGLFERLDNEGQAAFVLCHEMAHFLLHHSENSMQRYVETINSEEVQVSLHKIKGSDYHKREQLQSLVKGLTFDSRRHSRDHEAQADSLAVQLMRNTRYGVNCALTALAILDNIDKDSLNIGSVLPAMFNAPEYPFRKKWLMHDEGLLGGHAKIGLEEMADSLKTHPDCEKRILLLEKLMKGWTQSAASRFVVDSIIFVSQKNQFRYETIEYAYISENYSESLFLALDLLQTKPQDIYLITQVGKLLNGIYAAQKSHILSKVTNLPSPGYPANYNLLLQFIQNLYLEDIASINYYYLKQYQPNMDQYAPYRNAYQQSEKLVKN
jgi:Zn-dependent protease with chaperone function